MMSAVADLRSGARDAPPTEILSISCSVWENMAKSPPPRGSWRPLLGEILDPLLVSEDSNLLFKHFVKICLLSHLMWIRYESELNA